MNDPAEWTSWLEEHGPALLLLARQWATNQTDAEDIVQEAFLRFWRSRERAEDRVAYLYACVKRCIFERHRSEFRRARREQAAARHEDSGGSGLFVQQLACDERRALVEAALRELPEVQREVLVMKIWGRLSFPQIAAALEISPNTAASRYRYALAVLRTRLAEEPCCD